MKKLKIAAVFLALACGSLWADDADNRSLLASQLKYQTGDIKLEGDIAELKLGDNYKFLDAKQTKIVLEEIWGNPESDDLGLLVPKDFNPLSPSAWAIVISYSDDGYIKDEDAEKIDYDKLLKQMQQEVLDSNEERKKENYPAVNLVGWATQPKYNKETHKMFWAKEIKFGDDTENTLNYNIRVLGRKGVLVLNAIADMKSLKTIEQKTPEILSMVDFTSGNRYTDFNESTDKIASYGLAALVAGGLGVAAKTGLIKGLWVAVLAFKKFILMGLVALGGIFKSVFKKKKENA